jgi:hypothetical protein
MILYINKLIESMTLNIQDQYVVVYKTQQQCLGKRGKECKQNEMHTYYKKTKKLFDFGFYYGNSLLVKVVAKA